ncbi:hypothetical protein F5Y06DRAFT_133863 [Hypoxylon sp. FL0890]|nr:hypothetical protein F5Y06DRAFT_133863 [Hypoxylon sp. FL0890]
MLTVATRSPTTTMAPNHHPPTHVPWLICQELHPGNVALPVRGRAKKFGSCPGETVRTAEHMLPRTNFSSAVRIRALLFIVTMTISFLKFPSLQVRKALGAFHALILLLSPVERRVYRIH